MKDDKTPAIVALLTVLVLIYLSNSGKLAALKAVISSSAPGGSNPVGGADSTGAPSGPLNGPIGPGGSSNDGSLPQLPTFPGNGPTIPTGRSVNVPIGRNEAASAINEIEKAFRGVTS